MADRRHNKRDDKRFEATVIRIRRPLAVGTIVSPRRTICVMVLNQGY
jgi:hypothetical protein